MKTVWTALIIVVLSVNCMAAPLTQQTSDQQPTKIELQEARQVAMEFTARFLRTSDLNLLVKDLFLKDFIDHYKTEKAKDLTVKSPRDLYFVPGLEYNSRLLAEASTEDWLRFYTSATNFMFFGVVSGIKNYRNGAELSVTDLYPATVIDLLNKNPTLSNMLVRKGKSKAVGSVAEMRKATDTLEQAVSLMRQNAKGQSPLNPDEKELMKVMEADELFRPTVETVDDQFFGLPRGARVMFINTPILFRLILVKGDNNKLQILWAEPYIGS